MVNFSFQKWCAEAVSRIVFVPDRLEVERELYQHMRDRYEYAVQSGLDPKEAEKQTLAALGDPQEIAPQLGQIHRPFWGRFHLLTRQMVAVMLCVSLFCLCTYLLKSYVLFQSFTTPVYYRYDPFQDRAFSDTTVEAFRLDYGEPLSAALSDGYLFSLQKYALWEDVRIDSRGALQETEELYVQLQVISLVPWSSHTDISRWFRARDDLGNEYLAAYEAGDGTEPALQASWYHTAPCVYTHIIRFSDYLSQDAQWIDLYYDRAGRNIVLRIDLTGETEQ